MASPGLSASELSLHFPSNPDSQTRRKRTRKSWNYTETILLINLMKKERTQSRLDGLVHNAAIWQDISKSVPGRNGDQCHDRWSYLRRRYREARKKNTISGRRWITCPFYQELDQIYGKRPKSSAASSSSRSAGGDVASDEPRDPSAPASDEAMPTLPDGIESEDDEDDEDDEDEVDMEDAEGDDIQDLFGQRQGSDLDMSGEVAENNGNKSSDPMYAADHSTTASRSKRTPSSAAQNPKKRGRPKLNAPPRDDLTVAQAITDATSRYIDHQSFHLTEQTKLLQRYLKFERARMRWEMDMETRRMKWEEEREMREEERRQRQEEIQAKRVAENREFMLQMAVVLGNGASKDKDENKT